MTQPLATYIDYLLRKTYGIDAEQVAQDAGNALSILAGSFPSPQGPAFVNMLSLGLDPTGVKSISGLTNAAFLALALTGQAAYFPAGVYRIDTPITIPSGLVLWCSPDASFVSHVVGAPGNALTSPFIATAVFGGPAGALAAAVTVGASAFSSSISFPAGSLVVISGPAGNPASVYTTGAPTGLGPFNIPVDRPIVLPYPIASPVRQLASRPTGFRFCANGASLTTTGGASPAIRLMEFEYCLDCHVYDLQVPASVVVQDSSVAFTLGSLSCTVERTRVLGGFNAAIRFEHCEDSFILESTGANIGGGAPCIAFADCVASGAQDCTTYGGLGYYVGTDSGAFTPGCRGVSLRKVSSGGTTAAAVWVTSGAADTEIDALYSLGTGGILLDTTMGPNVSVVHSAILSSPVAVTAPAGATGVVLDDLDVTGCLDFLHAATDVKFSNIRGTGMGGGTALFSLTNGADVEGDNVSLATAAATTVNAVLSTGTVRACFDRTELALGVNSNGFIPNSAGSLFSLNDCKVTPAGGAAGVSAFFVNAGTMRLGTNCDGDTCATPLTVSAGAFCNRKQNVVAAAGGTAVAWPALKHTDSITLIPTAAHFTGWVSAFTPGTGFTVTDAAGGTYEYLID
jgi:hypothetical protein